MKKTYKARDIQKGYHSEGYRIDKTVSPLDFYTKWEITAEKKWINPQTVTFHSMPQDGWYKDKE